MGICYLLCTVQYVIAHRLNICIDHNSIVLSKNFLVVAKDILSETGKSVAKAEKYEMKG